MDVNQVLKRLHQECVMGPLIFTLYINGFPGAVDSFVKIFADDTKIFRAVETLEDCEALQDDINKAKNWSEQWQLPFHVEKCKIMHFGGENREHVYTMNNTEISSTDLEKDLGVHFDMTGNLNLQAILTK